jgi:hypothetical protein
VIENMQSMDMPNPASPLEQPLFSQERQRANLSIVVVFIELRDSGELTAPFVVLIKLYIIQVNVCDGQQGVRRSE